MTSCLVATSLASRSLDVKQVSGGSHWRQKCSSVGVRCTHAGVRIHSGKNDCPIAITRGFAAVAASKVASCVLSQALPRLPQRNFAAAFFCGCRKLFSLALPGENQQGSRIGEGHRRCVWQKRRECRRYYNNRRLVAGILGGGEGAMYQISVSNRASC